MITYSLTFYIVSMRVLAGAKYSNPLGPLNTPICIIPSVLK
ncbi:hypothetical protein QM9_0686 [Clostridioides difficile DA00238]|nr:hypothetical protein QM9_0686 [Clostridioides difficile DA00238]